MGPFQSIIITGASNGIGAALAIAYATPGVHLGLIGRDYARLAAVQTRCEERGATVTTGQIDITHATVLQDWLVAFDALHPVDLVIANAGISSTIGPQDHDEDWDTVQQVFEINTQGTLNTITPLITRMQTRRHGQIGIVSSLSAYVGMPISPAYCGSKAAIKVYGEALRGLLAPKGIGVSVVCPGFVKSNMSDRFPGPTPFKISAEQAAKRIQQGLAKNRARIAFPFPLALSMWFLSTLPTGWSLALQRLFRFG